jgi:hypothetical protein
MTGPSIRSPAKLPMPLSLMTLGGAALATATGSAPIAETAKNKGSKGAKKKHNMSEPLALLVHFLNSVKPYKVLGITLGAVVYIEINDDAEERVVLLRFAEALELAANTTSEMARGMQYMTANIEQ